MRAPPSQVQKMNANLMISLLMKNIGMRKCSQLCRTTPIAELIITFSSCIFRFFCTLVSAHCYPASMLYCRRGCSSVLVERFIVCRDESGKGNTKWQKGKINFAVPSDLHGLLPTSSDPKQRADEHTWIYIASLSLLSCSRLCLASCLTPQEGISYSSACRKEGMREGRRGYCQDVKAELFCQMLPQLPHNECLAVPIPSLGRPLATDKHGQLDGIHHPVSDGQIAMLLAYILYTQQLVY